MMAAGAGAHWKYRYTLSFELGDVHTVAQFDHYKPVLEHINRMVADARCLQDMTEDQVEDEVHVEGDSRDTASGLTIRIRNARITLRDFGNG